MDRKQAVILIHGIGEQKPNQTLRSFVRAVAGDRFYNKADHISSIPEMRRLQLFGDKNTHPTDCYELYWAHNTQEKALPVVLYFARLLFKKNSQFDARQLKYVTLLRILSVALLASFLYASFSDTGATAAKIASVLLPPLMLYLTYRFAYNYFGKASAYLNPSHDNIDNRSKIRNQGIELLRKIHQSGKYFRVTVVGHSLGSVIGYDILRHYWNTIVPDATMTPPKGKYFEEFRQKARVLDDHSLPRAQRLELFQQAQHELWRRLRGCGFPWLVTDLVTLGSPLAHAPVLMWESADEFAQRKAEREYPECPPNGWRERELNYPYPLKTPQGPRTFNRPEQDCLFAPTRWTNIYFEGDRLFRGDVVGGPLAGLFGQGVRDVAVDARGEPLLCHTGYWRQDAKASGPYAEALKALLSALRLQTRRSKEDWPEP